MVEEVIIRTLVGISLIVFVAKLLGSFVSRYGVPAVIGEILAGVILGPASLGQFLVIPPLGGQLIELNEIFLAFAEMGGIVILFAAGLEFTFAEFRAVGKPSFIVGGLGVIIPFLLGYVSSIMLGYGWHAAMLIGAALTATSIAITVRVLTDMGVLRTREGVLMVNAAVIDDVLGLSVLAVVISVVQFGAITDYWAIGLITLKAIGFWFVLLIGAVYILPHFIKVSALLRSEGAVESAATASCFGVAALASAVGLSPIIGSFAAGMALAASEFAEDVRHFVERLKMIFGPLFFALTGAYLNPLKVVDVGLVAFLAIFVAAMFSKIFGCGLPAAISLKSMNRGLRVGIGMASRGEVGLIVAGIGLAAGVIDDEPYAALLLVIMATTIIAPFLLKRSFEKEIRWRRRLIKRKREEPTKEGA